MRFTALILSAVALLFSAAGYPQEPSSTQPTFTEAISVGYVMVPFTVLGTKGAPLTNLKSSEIALYVDGKRVRTDLFEKSMKAPVSFTILLDASGSMALAGKMESARAAVSVLLDRRRPGDEFALYTFAESEATEVVPFTKDGDKIRRAMFNVKPWGKTAFFDALATMPDRPDLGDNPTKAIILLSDGIDNASRHSRASLARIFEGSSTPIYPLGLREPAEQKQLATTSEELSDLELLEAVATLTGGKLHLGITPVDLARGVDSLQKDLRAQYLVGFSPTGKGDVRYRKITLRIAGRNQVVRVRAGYRGTEPPVSAAATRGKQRNERKGSS